MKHRDTRRLRDLCAHASDDDGLDPRYDRKDSDRSRPNRKDLSLCKQAMRALDLEFASWPWAIDAGLMINAVEPAPDATCLRVLVSWSAPDLARSEVLARLGARGPSLRAAVALVITRKRAPRLEFEAAPRDDDAAEIGGPHGE
jgi:hypothetical protein